MCDVLCNSKSIKLRPEIIEKVRNELQTNYTFPAIHTEVMDDINLINEKYLVSILKTPSIDVYIFLIRVDDSLYNILIINDELIAFHASFDTPLYSGTLFRATLCLTKQQRWHCYIVDIIYKQGELIIGAKTLLERLTIIHELLRRNYHVDHLVPFDILLSSYFLFNHINLISDDCTLMFTHHTDFQTIYLYEYNVPKPKVKYCHGELKLLKTTKTDMVDVYRIHDLNNVDMGILTVSCEHVADKLKSMFKHVDTTNTVCFYDENFGNWRLMFDRC